MVRTELRTQALLVCVALSAIAGCKKKNRDSEGPAPTLIQWNANANAYRAQIGAVLSFSCPPGGTPSSVWGTDMYTSDSSICGAAAHSGRIQPQAGGVVQIQIAPGQPSYQGTIRAGIATLNFGAYPGSFTIVGGPAPGLVAVPVPSVNVNAQGVNIGGIQIGIGNNGGAGNPWSANARNRRGQNGTSFVHECPPGGAPGSVWGSGPYTDDSSICTAAVHAGRIQLASGGPVTVFIHPGRSSYTGSEANGITTRNFGSYPGSFSFDAVLPAEATAPPGSELINWSANGVQERGKVGTTRAVFCPPGGSPGSVWGSNPYTDDSSICTAAVHAGRIQFATGGVVNVRVSPGFPRYVGTTRNGVTTSNFARYPGSFLIMP
jgi:hypothetical protein